MENINEQKATNKILQLKRELFELRLKKATKQNVQPHLFKRTKKRLAKLLTMQGRKY